MKLKRIETPGIAHYAYLVADDGVAAVIDPSRDVSVYLEAALDLGVRITHVIETHRHEDFVMGSASLARRTGAKVVNGGREGFGHGDIALTDGETLTLGSLKIRALHTPGHTPESMCYAVFSAEDPERAWGVFTGDTLMFGDTGRTDLPDKDEQEANAKRIYASIHEKLAPLGDSTLVFPAHGPGSVCGSGTASRTHSTLGAERGYNAVFQKSREAFVADKGSERLPRPPYFRHMEEVNLEGGLPPADTAASATMRVSPEAFADRDADEVLIDTRSPEAFCGAHVPGAYSVWLGGLPVFGGWVARHDTPVALVTEGDSSVTTAVEHLATIGIDDVRALRGGFGAWRGSGRTFATAGRIGPRELEALDTDAVTVLDVREADEFASGHVPGAIHCYVGHLERNLEQLALRKDAPIVVTCGIGHRASVGVSILLRRGFSDVRNLLGGMKAWSALDLPTASE